MVLLGEPVGETTLKAFPDEHSLGAAWAEIGELAQLPLRGPEAREVLEYVAAGGVVHPIELIRPEGSMYRSPRPA